MRFGYVTPNSWGVEDPQRTVGLAVLAEELGLDAVWVSHHVLHAGFVKERLGRRAYHDPLVMLTAFAGATTVRLGTSVLFRFQVRLQPALEELTAPDWRSRVAAYESAGIDELLLGPLSGDVELHRRWLQALAEGRG
jgi:hypothetical protein